MNRRTLFAMLLLAVAVAPGLCSAKDCEYQGKLYAPGAVAKRGDDCFKCRDDGDWSKDKVDCGNCTKDPKTPEAPADAKDSCLYDGKKYPDNKHKLNAKTCQLCVAPIWYDCSCKNCEK